jgi:hypothetical protein
VLGVLSVVFVAPYQAFISAANSLIARSCSYCPHTG